MSALAALSLIAPAAPTAPQGMASEDASLFQGLLLDVQDDAVSGESMSSSGYLKAQPTRDAPDDAADDAQSPDASSGVVTGVVVVAAPVDDAVSAAASQTQANISGTATGAMAALAVPPTAAAFSSAEAQPANAEAQPANPSVQSTDGVETGDAAVQAAGGKAASSAEAVKATSALVVPASLKPQGERAVRPLDAASRAVFAGESEIQSGPYAPADGAKGGVSGAMPVQPVEAGSASSGPSRAPSEVPVVAADAVIADDAGKEARPAQTESASAATHASAPREAALSSLSRTTIDATAQIAAQILRKLEGRSTRFEMSLTPDELGRVDVKLDIDAEGRLAARLAFDNPAAAADLRGRADELRRQLLDAGFHLADDAFEFADRDSGSSAFDRGQGGDGRQNRAFSAASRLNAEADLVQPPRWMSLSLTPAGVDVKV